MEQTFVSALILSSDPAIRDNLRWAIGELVDEVLVADSWAAAMGIARSREVLLAVVDFDSVPGHVERMLVTALRTRAHAAIIAVGGTTAREKAAAVGVTLVIGKPLAMPTLMGHVTRIVGGRHNHGEAVF